MKTILVTGGAGFIGSHLIAYLLKNTDWKIVSLDRLDFSGNLNRLQEIVTELDVDHSRVKLVWHDLKAELNPMVSAKIGSVDYIAHLAAGSHVDRSIEYPLEFVQDNVIGTLNILEYARKVKPERFIYFSTDEVFGPAAPGVKFKEYDRYNSTNPYSASKAGAEELVVAYHNTYGIPAIITHTMNVFGERQHPEKFIPMCIKKSRDREVITIHANAELTKAGSRHYIHAEDVADAVYFILNISDQNLRYAASHSPNVKCPKFNIVGAEELDNLQLCKLIAQEVKQLPKYELVDFHTSRPGHDLRYALDGSLLAHMGWMPNPIRERLAQTVAWTLENDRWLIT